MGGCFDSRTYSISDKKEIESKFREAQRSSRRSSGSEYSGEIGVMQEGIGRWHDLRLASSREADDWLQEHHNKWESAEAVSFCLPVEPGSKQLRAQQRASDACKKADEQLAALRAELTDKIRKRKGLLVPCRVCSSRIAHACVRGVGCPACNNSTGLLTDAQAKRLDKQLGKLHAAQQAAREASKPVPSKSIGWVVGGWCSS